MSDTLRPDTASGTARIYFAPGLHMHQPPGNLQLLIEHNTWEARQIMCAYERAARYAHKYKDVGRLQVGFSGVLLEQLCDPDIIDRYRDIVDIPQMLAQYREAENIEIIGMGYYHPIFPLIPVEDWDEHLEKGRQIVTDLFGRAPAGFWPPEMAFSMEMIPALKRAGYTYVIVDHVHVDSQEGCALDPFQPYRAEYEGESMVIIPRHRDMSNAQESGLNPGWFIGETLHKVKHAPHPQTDRLLTTWSDGENGGWFRQMDDAAGFFGYFFGPLMDMIRQGDADITPVNLASYVAAHPPQVKATVRTGAWNIGSTSGHDFSQWHGSESQKRAVEALFDVSRRYWERHRQAAQDDPQLRRARQIILDAETSCYLFWGEAWLPKLFEKVEAARVLLS